MFNLAIKFDFQRLSLILCWSEMATVSFAFLNSDSRGLESVRQCRAFWKALSPPLYMVVFKTCSPCVTYLNIGQVIRTVAYHLWNTICIIMLFSLDVGYRIQCGDNFPCLGYRMNL